MNDRYDDSERGRRAGERREEYERNDWGREEPYNRGRGSRGNWEEPYRGEERFGRGDWERERRPYYGEYGSRGEFGNRGEYGGRGEYGRGEFGNRGEFGGRGEFNEGRGEFGRGFEGRQAWRGGRGEWGRERSGNEGPWGTGSRGFGTGYRSGEFSSGGGAFGGYGGYGGYTGYGSAGPESYSGGAGTYGYGQQGQFSGRGPKGYHRSDDRIREDVCERLTQHPDIDAAEIEIQVKDGEVTLTGTVDDRQTKRMAEDVAENVSGVKDVRNQVQVQQRQMAGAHQGRSESGTERSGSEKTGQKR